MSTTAEKLTLIAENEQKVYDAGKTQGYTEGKSAGYQNAKSEIEEVTVTPTLEAQEILPTEPNLISKVTVKSGQALYDEGKQAQYDAFWDAYQSHGDRVFYARAFAGRDGWKHNIFKPKYDMKPLNAMSMFQEYKDNWGNVDLREIGVDIDFSACVQLAGVFQYSTQIVAIGIFDTTAASALGNTFNEATGFHTIEKMKLKTDGTQTFSSTFYKATALKNIAIEGVIGNTLDMRWSPLSKDSIIGKLITPEEYEALSDSVKNYNVFEFNGNYYYGGVITALKSDATGKTLTLKKTAVNTAFGINVDDETTYPAGSEFYELRHSKDNWTFSYV